MFVACQRQADQCGACLWWCRLWTLCCISSNCYSLDSHFKHCCHPSLLSSSSSSFSSSCLQSNLSRNILLLLSRDHKLFGLPLHSCTWAQYRLLASSTRLTSLIGFSTYSFQNRGHYGAHVPNMLFLLFLESSDLRSSSMPILVAVWVCRCYEAHVLDKLSH